MAEFRINLGWDNENLPVVQQEIASFFRVPTKGLTRWLRLCRCFSALGGLFAAGSLVRLRQGAINMADEMGKLAEKTGISAKAAVGLSYARRSSGHQPSGSHQRHEAVGLILGEERQSLD